MMEEVYAVENLFILSFGMIFLQVLYAMQAVKKNPRRWQIRPINQRRLNYGFFLNTFRVMKEHDIEEYFKYTRMSPENFDVLCNMIRDHPVFKRQRKGKRHLPVEERLCITLSYLAHGSSMKSVAVSFLRGHSTVSEVVRETCKVLSERLQPIVMRIPTFDEWTKIQEDFNNMWNLPNCLGALDGKHVAIKKPKKTGSEYHNYKDGFSTVLLALADANYMFRLVDIGQYGSASDGGIFSRSPIGQWWNSGKLNVPETSILPGTNVEMPTFIAADAAFPLKTNILKPYGKPRNNESLPESHRIFNYRLSRGRRVVENAFGILVSRFRIFEKPIQADVKTVDAIVQAAVMLHNFLRITTDPERLSPTCVDRYSANGELIEGDWRKDSASTCLVDTSPLSGNRAKMEAHKFRSDMTRYFMSAEGHIPDQEKVLDDFFF